MSFLSLPETNSQTTHLKIGLLTQKETGIKKASIFRCDLLVSGRVAFSVSPSLPGNLFLLGDGSDFASPKFLPPTKNANLSFNFWFD